MKRSRKTLFALLLALVMTLGLTATAWAAEGDSGTVGPPEGPEFGNYEEQKQYEIPFTKTVKLGGNTAPGKTDFTIAVCDVGVGSLSDYTDVTYKVVITTNGAGSFDGKLIISGPATQVDAFIIEGFYVR